MIRRSILLILTGLGATGASAAPPAVQTGDHFHVGICDGSTAVAIGPDEFLVANDDCSTLEETVHCNKLFVYKSDVSGGALKDIEITGLMDLEKKKKEADLEGSAALCGRVYWIASHGRNSDGEIKRNRHQLFAVKVEGRGDQVVLAAPGKPYTKLLDDLLENPSFKGFTRERLAKDTDPELKLAAEEPGAVNIEGLTAWQGDRLLIGFRNPVPEGKALLIPLENAGELVSDSTDRKATLGEFIQFDLGGRGIRSIEYWPARDIYLILAGPIGEKGTESSKQFRLYQWSGMRTEVPREIPEANLSDLNPEAIVVYPGVSDRFQVLSDDGQNKVGGVDCKKLNDDNPEKRFRSRWIGLPPA